jgi:hypothetical protein
MEGKWWMHTEAMYMARLNSLTSYASPNRGSANSLKLFVSSSGLAYTSPKKRLVIYFCEKYFIIHKDIGK